MKADPEQTGVLTIVNSFENFGPNSPEMPRPQSPTSKINFITEETVYKSSRGAKDFVMPEERAFRHSNEEWNKLISEQ